MIHAHVLERVARHGRILGVLRVLYDSCATALFDGLKSCCAVIQAAGQNDANDLSSE